MPELSAQQRRRMNLNPLTLRELDQTLHAQGRTAEQERARRRKRPQGWMSRKRGSHVR